MTFKTEFGLKLNQRNPKMNNVINWNDAPEWATHCAQDASGKWYWYPQDPHTQTKAWAHHAGLVGGTCAAYYKTTPVIGDWKDTLIERPKQETKMTDLNELQQRLNEAQALVNKLQQEVEAKAAAKYELQGGDYTVLLDTNEASCARPSKTYAEAGLERKTEALAQSSLKQLRAFSRMLAYVHEHCPEFEADWGDDCQEKFFVYFNSRTNLWVANYTTIHRYPTVCMNKVTAEKLASDLNSSRFSLE